MVEPSAHVHAAELSAQINRLHINYLQADESPQKIEQRIKLENYIRKYLYLVAHGSKFIFPETAEVLHQSVESKENFSGYRASTAWNALARYAANLVAQPWRKEFRIIKTFSGFYMHDIEENLVGAELLLERMGYKLVDHSVLALELPLDLDAVMEVSRDAIVAFVECQILKEIWEGVSPQFECSWLEILEFRETHVCTADTAIKQLTYRYHQNRFHQQPLMSAGMPLDPYCAAPRFHHHSTEPSCMYGQVPPAHPGMPYYGYPTYPSYPVAPQPRYASLVSPQQIMAPPGGYSLSPIGYQHPKTPAEMYPANGYHYTHSSHMMPAQPMHNGYMTSQPTPVVPPNYGCVVPTGQLIELDNSAPTMQVPHPTRIHKPLPDDLQALEIRNGNSSVHLDRNTDVYNDEGSGRRERPTDLYASVTRSDTKCNRPTTLDDLKPRRNGIQTDHLPAPRVEDSFARMDKSTTGRQTASTGKHQAKKGSTSVPAAPMQDGTGTWESWDYVYRNLESQGYSKDVGERGDILDSPGIAGQKESAGSGGSSRSTNENYIRNSRNIRDFEAPVAQSDAPMMLSANITDAMHHLRLDNNELLGGCGQGEDAVDSRGRGYNNTSPKKGGTINDKTSSKITSGGSKTLSREARREQDRVASATLDMRTVRSMREVGIENGNRPFWECVTCTFHNNTERVVCEMCGKSRQPGPEDKPLVSGGRECPKCTLVNKRGVVSCEACNENLKDSPTYI